MIAAVSLNGVFGNKYTNKLPWSQFYPEDLKFFRNQTINSTIIFGRNTLESISSKPLPKRRNILISSKDLKIDGIETFKSLQDGLKASDSDVWLIGGFGIYSEGLNFADEIYITSIPEFIDGDGLIYFPYINPNIYNLSDQIELNKDKNLICNIYKKII